jgi:hypothetical protein
MCYGGNINYNEDDDDDKNNNICTHFVRILVKERQKKTLLRIYKIKHISIERYLDLMARCK